MGPQEQTLQEVQGLRHPFAGDRGRRGEHDYNRWARGGDRRSRGQDLSLEAANSLRGAGRGGLYGQTVRDVREGGGCRQEVVDEHHHHPSDGSSPLPPYHTSCSYLDHSYRQEDGRHFCVERQQPLGVQRLLRQHAQIVGRDPVADKRKGVLSKLFDVEGIPTLVILDAKTGAVINANGRGAIASDPEGVNFPWTPPAVAELSSSADGINETTSVCLMLEGCSAEVKAELGAALLEIAESSKAAGEDLIFFYAKESDGPLPQVRKLTKLGDAGSEPALVLLDIPDNGGYYTCDTKVTAETIRAFLADYKAGGKLERKQLG